MLFMLLEYGVYQLLKILAYFAILNLKCGLLEKALSLYRQNSCNAIGTPFVSRVRSALLMYFVHKYYFKFYVIFMILVTSTALRTIDKK